MYLINQGHVITGFTLAGGTLVALAAIFITGRREENKNQSESKDPGEKKE